MHSQGQMNQGPQGVAPGGSTQQSIPGQVNVNRVSLAKINGQSEQFNASSGQSTGQHQHTYANNSRNEGGGNNEMALNSIDRLR